MIVCMAAQKAGALSVRELLRSTGVRMKRLDAIKINNPAAERTGLLVL
jgi:hypothetical protein